MDSKLVTFITTHPSNGGFARFRPVRFQVLAVLVSLVAAAAFGAPTLKTIAVDGDPSDWSDVLTNSFQVTVDGNGTLTPCSGIDLDCEISSTGRDIGRFAWTYDSSNVYLYLERLGSTSNTQTFYFYMDVDRDRVMGAADFVLQADYQGSNRSTDRSLYRYDPNTSRCSQAPAENALASPAGIADGWQLCGALGTRTRQYASVTAGFPNGEGFEAAVPWPDLGASIPVALFFHVSSGNGQQFPGQLDDNCGGPDDRIGTFGYFASDLAPSRTGGRAPGSTVTYDHSITNVGVFSDSFNLAAASSLGFTVEILDASNNPITSTPVLASGATFAFRIRVTIPAGAPVGAVDSVTITSTSVGEPTSVDTLVDQTAVGDVTLSPGTAKNVAVGDYVEYVHTITNAVLADRFDLRMTSPAGWRIDYYDATTLIAVDANGDGDFTDAGDSVTAGWDVSADGFPDVPVASGATHDVTLRLIPPAGAVPVVVDAEPLTVTSAANAAVASATDTTTLRPAVELTPSWLAPSNFYGGAGLDADFPHVLRNNRSAASTFTLAGSNPAGWAVTFWTDPNGDGSASDGVEISGPTPSVGGNGGELRLVARVSLPLSPATTQTISALSATGTAGTASASDEVRVSKIAPFRDSAYSVQSSAFASCTTIYAKGFTLAPGTTYTIEFRDPSNTLAQTRSQVATVGGEAFDNYLLLSADVSGLWTVRLLQGATLLDQQTVSVELAGAIPAVATGRVSYPATGSTLTATASYRNDSAGADYSGTTLRLVVRDLAATSYLRPDGTFGATSGADDTASATATVAAGATTSFGVGIAGTTFPSSPAIYRLTARWTNGCGITIATASRDFLVGPTLGTYSALGPDVAEAVFFLGETVHGAGTVYFPSLPQRLGVYDPAGALVASFDTAAADGAGRLTGSWPAAASTAFGPGWRLTSYPAGAALPAVFPVDDPNRFAASSFALWRGRTPVPAVVPILNPGESTVSGTSTAAPGSTIRVYLNGSLVGTTTVGASGAWSLSGLGPLANGDSVTATAEEPEWLVSSPSSPVGVSVRLLRSELTSVTPPVPALSTIFPRSGAYSMDPAVATESASFASAGAFAHEATDLTGPEPLVFYEVNFATGTLRLAKGAAKVVVTY